MYHGEKLNSISHLIGAALSLMALGSLITISAGTGDVWVISSFCIFGFSMVLLYTMSTLYHSFQFPELKKVFQKLDHVSIYVLIAGTYTPYMLVTLREGNGWLIMSVVWVLAAIGIFLDTVPKKRQNVLTLCIYLGMGWAIAFDYSALKAGMPEAGVDWLLGGGIAYTAGVVFYVADRTPPLIPHAHGIWHFFVLAGTICHFISIAGYVR